MGKPKPVILSFEINAPLDPMARGELEDPLYAWLEQQGAEIVDGGGGTMLHSDGRVIPDFFVEFAGRSHIRGALKFMRESGLPAGSTYKIDNGATNQIGDTYPVFFSIKKPLRFGPKRSDKLWQAVENATVNHGRLLVAHETKGRLVFQVFGYDVELIQQSLVNILPQYAKYDPRIETTA